MKSIFAAAALFSGLAFTTVAHATPIMYQFSASRLGGAETGFFTFDAATNQASAISITAEFPNSGLNGLYTQAGPSTPPSKTPIIGYPRRGHHRRDKQRWRSGLGGFCRVGTFGRDNFLFGVALPPLAAARKSTVNSPDRPSRS